MAEPSGFFVDRAWTRNVSGRSRATAVVRQIDAAQVRRRAVRTIRDAILAVAQRGAGEAQGGWSAPTGRAALASLAERIRAAFVYGSSAKGTDRAASDIDVMVISDDVDYTELFSALGSRVRACADRQPQSDVTGGMASQAEAGRLRDAHRRAAAALRARQRQ